MTKYSILGRFRRKTEVSSKKKEVAAFVPYPELAEGCAVYLFRLKVPCCHIIKLIL